MSTKATERELSELHSQLATVLKEAIKPEDALDEDGNVVGKKYNTAALNAARQFLKDNNITSSLDSAPVRSLIEDLPNFDDPAVMLSARH